MPCFISQQFRLIVGVNLHLIECHDPGHAIGITHCSQMVSVINSGSFPSLCVSLFLTFSGCQLVSWLVYTVPPYPLLLCAELSQQQVLFVPVWIFHFWPVLVLSRKNPLCYLFGHASPAPANFLMPATSSIQQLLILWMSYKYRPLTINLLFTEEFNGKQCAPRVTVLSLCTSSGQIRTKLCRSGQAMPSLPFRLAPSSHPPSPFLSYVLQGVSRFCTKSTKITSFYRILCLT